MNYCQAQNVKYYELYLLYLLGDSGSSINLPLANRSIRAEASREMNTIACPARDQTFGIGNGRHCVLNNIQDCYSTTDVVGTRHFCLSLIVSTMILH